MIAALFAGRPVVALGVSAGALVALALRSPQVVRVIAVEPFFSTEKLWPLVHTVRKMLANNPRDATMRRWVEAIYGYGPETLMDRDYGWVLGRTDRPVEAIVGSDPLYPVRNFWDMPSLTDDIDRDRLRGGFGAASPLGQRAGQAMSPRPILRRSSGCWGRCWARGRSAQARTNGNFSVGPQMRPPEM